MNKEFKGLSNGHVFQSVFKKFDLLKQFAKDVYEFDLTGYHFINSEYSKVSDNECTLTLTNGTKNVLVEMECKKLEGFDDKVVFFTHDIGPIMYQKIHKKIPTIILGSRRYL